MTAGQRSKQEWVAGLAELEPDLVIDTGDNLAGFDAVPTVMKALDPLLDRPGRVRDVVQRLLRAAAEEPVQVLLPRPQAGARHPAALARPARRHARPRLAGPHQRRRASWWSTAGGSCFAGVDDSHLRRDRYDLVAGEADRSAEVRIGLAHSPEPRVLDRFAADGYDLLLCGHTHGGQLRVPFYGALVTNCGIDRERVRWLHRWAEPTPEHPSGTWLHVSAGLGTSPYAPVRFACPPEATLLTLTARGAPASSPLASSRGPARRPGARALDSAGTAGCGAAW